MKCRKEQAIQDPTPARHCVAGTALPDFRPDSA